MNPRPHKLAGERLVSLEKITDYLLDPQHPEGGGKAKFFMAHGFKAEEPGALMAAIHDHAELNDVDESIQGRHGTKSIVRCSIRTPDGRNPCILVVWIREHDCDTHRMVTAYPNAR